MKIPESIYNFSDMVWISYDYEKDMLIKREEEFLLRNWYDSLMESDKLIYGHECHESDPAGIEFNWN